MTDETGGPLKPGESTGEPAGGRFELASSDTMGRPGFRHWAQSVITEPGLEDRGGVFFAALEMTRMPMILTDPNLPDNPIVFANNAFLDLTGYETAEIVGRNCRFLQGTDTDRDTVRQVRHAVEAHEAVAVELLNYRRDGSAFWNALFTAPVFDPDGKLLYFFASQLDVTRRREAEQQTRQAQKMESIGQLTAGVAHDFNNLLHVIAGSLERIEARAGDAEAVRRYTAAANVAAERGVKLTRQLLAFARRSRLEPKDVDVSTLVASIGELLETTAGSKVDLQLSLRRRLPQVRVDPVHLEMALLNIVINARDAVGENGAITVATGARRLNGEATSHDLRPGEYVTLSIADDGPGMEPHVKARATEPFFTTKAPGEGTGLGLAMAHGFAQQSGGKLEIQSEVGGGTTITFLLPAAPARGADADDAPRFEARPVSASAPPLILIVEDNSEIAGMAEETLREIGYRVVRAASAEEGLRRFEEARAHGGFDLIFSDVIMPGGMNGLAFVAEVRKRDPEVAILMTTGYNDDMSLQGPQPEAMDVLGKPYRRTELIDRVQEALRRTVATGPERAKSDFGVAQV